MVEGLGFSVKQLGMKGFGFRILGLAFRVRASGFRRTDLGSGPVRNVAERAWKLK